MTEEPGARKSHAGSCAGGLSNWHPYRDPYSEGESRSRTACLVARPRRKAMACGGTWDVMVYHEHRRCRMSTGTDPRPDQGTDQEVAFFDLLDPRFQPDAPEVHAAREACWYARTPLGYAILRYEEMAALLRDRHLRQGGVETLALIDRFAAHGACEFMAAFADPYPSRIICALLGIPRERYAQFHGWATDLGLGFSYAVAAHLARIEAALQGLYACVDDLLTARRAAPGPDLISALLAAEEAGDRLHDEELRAMVALLVFGGQDTVRNQLGCALTTFLEHPAQWARLAEEPALAPRAVEEVMRVRPAVPAVWRVAAEDFEFKGLRIAAGTFLSMFAAAAHTDPRVYGAAEFDISLERPAQLSFGGGIHYCLGAPLARAEMEEALPILAARLRAPELTGSVPWRPAMGIRGPVTLPIRFRAAA